MAMLVPYVNGIFTLTENVLNCLSYLSHIEKKYRVNRIRVGFGCTQLITGAALVIFGKLAFIFGKTNAKASYLTFPQQAHSLGIFYINHGLYNLIRAGITYQKFGFLTFGYDFYGRKFLPALSPKADLVEKIFYSIREQLDRTHVVTILPFKWQRKVT